MKKRITIVLLIGSILLLGACSQEKHLYASPQVTELIQNQLPEGMQVYASTPNRYGEDEKTEDVLKDTEFIHAAVYLIGDTDMDGISEIFQNIPITGKINVEVYELSHGTSGNASPEPAELVKSFTIKLK